MVTALMIVYILICLLITVVILLQEGKQAGLGGTISGAAETFWDKNKGRSIEGKLETITKIAIVLFFVMSLVLNMSFIPR